MSALILHLIHPFPFQPLYLLSYPSRLFHRRSISPVPSPLESFPHLEISYSPLPTTHPTPSSDAARKSHQPHRSWLVKPVNRCSDRSRPGSLPNPRSFSLVSRKGCFSKMGVLLKGRYLSAISMYLLKVSSSHPFLRQMYG